MKTITVNSDKQSLNNVQLGENVKIYDFVNAYDCEIGDNTKVGTFVELQKNVIIGKNCKISSHSFLCEGVHIKDEVFIGHNVSFINDKIPRSVNEDGELQTGDDWAVVETHIEKGASIGTSSTLLCGITVGKNAVVGAGSVVTKDVLANTVVAGNPAKFIRNISNS